MTFDLRKFDRREIVTGGAAMAGSLGAKRALGLSSLLTGMSADNAVSGGPPMDYLSRTFPPTVLAKSLLSAKDWHPAPKANERTAWAALPEDLRQSVLARAAQVPKGPLPTLPASLFLHYHVTGSRQPYDDELFERRRRLTPLVLAECVEGKGNYIAQIADIVWATCEESFWGIPAHLFRQKAGEGLPDVTEPLIELYGAEMAMDLAWTYYLVGDGLDTISPLINKRIKLEVERRILEPGRTRDDFWWMGIGPKAQKVNNWNPWICSNWMAALLLLEDDRVKRIEGVSKILRCIDAFINQYPADAGEEEGPGYWSRSPACYFECVSLLVSALSGPVAGSDVLKHPFFRAMGEYIVKAHIAGEYFTNYGDAHLEAQPSGPLLYDFGKATGSETLQAFGAYRSGAREDDPKAGADKSHSKIFGTNEDLGRCLRRLLSTVEIRKARGRDGLLRDAWYPVLGFMSAREREGSTEGFYLAAQAARNGRSHGHCDSGSFLVYHDGDGVFVDLGATTYTKSTFTSDRFKLWALRSPFHNLPTIGDVEQDTGGKAKASSLEYEATDERARLKCNLATAYPERAGIKVWNRTMSLERIKGDVSITEDFALERALPVTLSFMTPRLPASASRGIVRLVSANASKKPVQLLFDPTELDVKIERIKLTDVGLKKQWGDVMYRVLLVSRGPVSAGNWKLRVTAE